jgi:hypothetical protein
VLKTVDPRDLRNEMQAKGRVDNLWKVFTDPTINKQVTTLSHRRAHRQYIRMYT